MPCSINETYLALVCAYHFLYCKDPHFIPRLSKAWESSSYRKSKKKSKKKPLETISSELSYGDHVSEVLSPSEGDVVKIEKDTLRENMHEVVIEKVIENVENKNPDLSDGQDNDPFSSLSSIALLGI